MLLHERLLGIMWNIEGEQVSNVIGGFQHKSLLAVQIAEPIKAKITVLVLVHICQGLIKEEGKQNADGPTVHGYQDGTLVGAGKDQVNNRSLSVLYIKGALTFFAGLINFATLPRQDQIPVVLVVHTVGDTAFPAAPADFVQPGVALVGYAEVNKPLDGLDCAAEGRCIYFIERYVLIGIKKSLCLSFPPFIELGINSASLYNTLSVVLGFAVPD